MVAIKGMEMPKECYRCPLLDREYGTCNIIGETKVDMTEKRANNCPLVEIVTCKDCKYCSFGLVKGTSYYWCEKDDCVTSEDFYCANAESEEAL